MILTQEQEMIRDSLRTFAEERLAPFAGDWDRHHTFPAAALRELGELGALGIVVPEQWGGADMDYMSLVLVLEEIAAGDGSTSTIVSVQNSLACGITLKYGNDEQKETWFKPLARGEKLICFCLTEPHTGTDASSITLRADRDGDHFVLNGVKQFITTGKYAQVVIVFAVTDKVAGQKGFPVSWCRPIHRVTSSPGSRIKWGSMLPTPRKSSSKTAAFQPLRCSAPKARATGLHFPIPRPGALVLPHSQSAWRMRHSRRR